MTRHKMACVFSGLWSADTICTLVFTHYEGTIAEANPVMRYIMEQHGMFAFVLTKAVVLMFYLLFREHIREWMHAVLILIMTIVVYFGLGMAVMTTLAHWS